ncbi:MULTISPECIES: cupin domain-containing protein [Microbacterium]|uniref:cupin domain-containing protein n=1 Tax=Microbacterium TaxID=33882 RepID=UPI000D65828F|nr:MULTISPECIES: cupin domain-containing protein [Microbacterium]
MRALTLEDDTGEELRYDELLRVPALSVGRYRLPVASEDPQQPHTEDEVYVIRSGRGILRTPAGDAAAVPGAVLFVPAGEEHRFVEIDEPLDVIVLFAPAEYSNKGASA